MSTRRDWLLRPVRQGMCRYESLVDGTLGLDAIADMNEALDVADENQARYERVAQQRDEPWPLPR
jgi:hypothetical protein